MQYNLNFDTSGSLSWMNCLNFFDIYIYWNNGLSRMPYVAIASCGDLHFYQQIPNTLLGINWKSEPTLKKEEVSDYE